jgi:phosphoribosylformimino-5-aminoimidazole carboxamide ribotide isomerase
MMVELFPAIDLHGGQVVRLTQGDYGSAIVYGSDPIAVAARLPTLGRRGSMSSISARPDPVRPRTVPWCGDRRGTRRAGEVQTGGGVRTLADAQQLAERAWRGS